MGVDIKGLNKAEVLLALCLGTEPLGMGVFAAAAHGAVSVKDAEEQLQRSSCVDYFVGRPIKTDFEPDELRETLYDRDAGPGAMAAVVARLREKTQK